MRSVRTLRMHNFSILDRDNIWEITATKKKKALNEKWGILTVLTDLMLFLSGEKSDNEKSAYLAHPVLFSIPPPSLIIEL